MIHADFKRSGKTILVVETPEGEIKEYNVTIEMNTYKIEEKQTRITSLFKLYM